MRSAQRCLVLGVFLSGLSACATTSLPWEFSGPRAKGYAIDLVDLKPAPGTPLAVGDSVDFVAKVKYSLSIASRGAIVLVFEDGNDHRVEQAPETFKRVDSPGGELTLRERITIPPDARKELRLFIPLVPDGIARTTGEITARYPIKRN